MSLDGTETPTRGRKRTLFSQSMIGNPLLNPESGQVLNTTSEESIMSGTVIGEESSAISPVVVGINSTRVDRGSETDTSVGVEGDDTLVENTDVNNDHFEDEVEVSTVANVSDKLDSEEFLSAESSGDEADETVEQEGILKLVRKGRASKESPNMTETTAAVAPVPTATIKILVASEDEVDDDIFSDASSVASINLSKLPKGATIDNSSEADTEEDEILAKSQSSPIPKKTAAKKGKSTKALKVVSSTRSSSSSPLPSSNLSARSSRSSAVSSPPPRSSRSSRSSRADPASNDETTATPPTVQRKNSTAKSNLTTASPVSMSRSGRKNSPRINYRTGTSLVVENTPASGTSNSRSSLGASPNLAKGKGGKDVQETRTTNPKTTRAPKVTTGRKRSKAVVSSNSSASSATSSPQPKKIAAEVVSTKKTSKIAKKNLTDSSDDFVESTPPARAKRSQSSTSSVTTSRSNRSARK